MIDRTTRPCRCLTSTAVPAAAVLIAVCTATADPASAAEPGLWTGGQVLDNPLPPGERAVRSLAVRTRVFGSTSGLAAHLFTVEGDRVVSLARLPDGVGLFGLCVAGDGRTLYAGTAAAPDLPRKYVKPDRVGSIVRFQLAGDGAPSAAATAAAYLGVPVAGQGIIAMSLDEPRGVLYGLTEPDGHLFAFDLKEGKGRSLGVVAGRRPHEQHLPAQVSRALAVTADGSVITGGAGGVLVKYDAKAGKVVKTGLTLPAVSGREPWASVEAFAPAGDGRLYGGTSDGYLFSADAGFKEILNHGKPLRQGGIHGLVAVRQGDTLVLYGVGGEKDGMPRGFAFEPARGAYRLGGIPQTGAGDAGLSMSGFGALAGDGRMLYAGERDRLGRVIRFAAPAVGGR
jgi:sugar lactone lactonase YvrE